MHCTDVVVLEPYDERTAMITAQAILDIPCGTGAVRVLEQEPSGYRYFPRSMPGDGVDGTQWMICSSVGLLAVVSFGVPLGCHWIASEPFLCACRRPRNFGAIANRTVLIDISIDRLRRAAVGSILGTGTVEVPLLPTIGAGSGGWWTQ